MTVLQVEGLRRILEDRERRFELSVGSIALDRGDLLAIVGPSGSGKTTLLDMLALATPPDACGLFRLGERDVTGLALGGRSSDLAALRRDHFGYVLQSANLLPFLTAHENVSLTQQIAGRGDAAHARALLDHLGVSAHRAKPAALSVGQRQRVAVARAFAHRPSIVLCDEPTAALDPVTARETLRLCVTLAQATGAGLAIVTHDAALAGDLGFRFLTVQMSRQGRVIHAQVGDAAAEPAT